MFSRVLIANRGAIACRIIRTLRRMGVSPVAVYSDADRHAAHVAQADAAVRLGPPAAVESYLQQDAIIDAALRTGAQAIHPGYGFLSENAGFVEACERAGLVFLGPTPAQMRALGLKHTAREIAEREGAPLLPGTGLLIDETHALDEAERCGYPVILKSTAGGGGIGMRVCRTPAELGQHFAAVARLGAANFGQGGVYLERFVERARHIEVQIFGDGAGGVVALGERDCSAQRRNQKVVEETPAPGLRDDVRRRLWDSAELLARAVKYRSAGTVEFLYDSDHEDFFFLEVNTRLQVEHGVTEAVTGVDIVDWMVRLGAGTLPPLDTLRVQPSGASIQVRVYAEDAAHDFRPSTGQLTDVRLPEGVRCDTWVERGTEVTPYYDPMLAKIIVRGATRAEAMARLELALAATSFAGLETNLDYLRQIVVEPEFRSGGFPTSFLSRVRYQPRAFEVIDPGMQTTVQDHPGRTGVWHVGVPPSGPMDPLAFRLVNRLVGNPDDAAGLECTMTGPRLRFFRDAVIALGGADMNAKVDGAPVDRWRAITVRAGSELRLGAAAGAGARAYIAVRGGLDVPAYLGSRATFILGKFGGHAGRVLRMGDMLRWHESTPPGSRLPAPESRTDALPDALTPSYSHEWEIGVLYGPHGAPDFFTDGDIATLFSASWKVHYNSDRTGVRLIGPRPAWARRDGGEAGLHPSNLHDNAYAIGAMDFTGDMPILLGPDGPSLGGFVCPAVVAQAELWKMGQVRAGDTVRFRLITNAQATRMERELDEAIATLSGSLPTPRLEMPDAAVLRRSGSTVHRAAGDRYLLVETGPNELSLDLRVRIHALEQLLRGRSLRGIVDVTPGIRSLQIHYDSRILPREELMAALEECERGLPDLDDVTIPSRVVHLPLSWEDPATLLAIEKYMQSVRADAPWCPSNTEFIRRINGLDSIEDVRQIVYGADYLVLGLGDVYLGAPVATPVDPRHRLVTTKYNPARTWTAENSVGIGGAYLCVYGMEGPGGYQFVGRTVQMWNTHRTTAAFEPGSPWLLRFFDRIRFHPVSAAELLEMRDAFPHGKYDVAIEPRTFSMRDYRAFLASIAPEARAAKQRQQAAFDAERERWAAAGQPAFVEPADDAPPPSSGDVPDGCEAVRSPMTANVWHVAVEPGQRVEAGQRILVLEAMKMEVEITAHTEGVVEVVHCAKGAMVTAGQNLATVRVDA
ncbi:MAG TPA: urea carboxylase [Vicinamibacterales bacterium]|nr:urea carboxylase [Vicinamibacterales bacterium]